MAEKKRFQDRKGLSIEEDLALDNDESTKELDHLSSLLEAHRLEQEFKDAIEQTTFRDILIDSRSDVFDLDYDGIYLETICMSFRFSVGNGFFFDYSLAAYVESNLTVVSNPAQAVRLLRIILSIVPRMKDGVEIEHDNYLRWGDSACDFFKGDCLPGTPSWGFDDVASYQNKKVGEFDGMPITQLVYFNTISFYAVYVGSIRVIFSHLPTIEDREWVSSLKPDLKSLDESIGSYYRHFVLWQDGSVGE